MSGTKHEKIVLVVLAYIIGLNSGVIAGGYWQDRVSLDEYYSLSEEAEEPRIEHEDWLDPANNSASLSNVNLVDYVDGKLYARSNGSRYVLSIDSDLLGNDIPEEFRDQGVHTDQPYYAVSDDERFIYFCERHVDADGCTGFVFDVAANMIHYIDVNGAELILSEPAAKTAVWSDQGLLIGDRHSISPDEPWKFVQE